MVSPGERGFWHRALGWQYLALCLLVAATLALHFAVIMHPPEDVFDEAYYVPAAHFIIDQPHDVYPEHPPLGKLMIASSMLIFGDNPFGWRFLSVMSGAAIIVLFYLVCRRLMPERAALFATVILSFEQMSFVQSSLAMLDVYMVALMMAGFWLYLRGNYLMSGVSIAASTLVKLTGGLALIAIGLHWLVSGRKRPGRFLASMALAPASFLVMLPLLDWVITRRLENPITRIVELLRLSGRATFGVVSQPLASRPWEWVLSPKVMPFFWEPQSYFSFTSFTVWALIIPAVLYMVFRALGGSNAARFGLAWFAATYLTWIPLSLATDRVSFSYYFYPTIGAICIGIGLGLGDLLSIRAPAALRVVFIAITGMYLLAHFAVLILFYPGLPPLVEFPNPYIST